MNFKEYIDKSNLDRVLDCIIGIHKRYPYDKFDEDSEREGYYKVIEQLNALTPSKRSQFTLHVTKFEDKHDGWEGQVTGKKKGDKENYAMEFTPWKKILAMNVESMYDIDNTVAYILWEITFFGFDQRQIKEKLDDLSKRVKNIKNTKKIDIDEARNKYK